MARRKTQNPEPPEHIESQDPSRPGEKSKNWAMLCHLSALSIYVGMPFGNFLGPLVIWMAKKEHDAFVDQEGKHALNLQLTIIFYFILMLLGLAVLGLGIVMAIGVAGLRQFVNQPDLSYLGPAALTLVLLAALDLVLMVMACFADFILIILAAIRAANGQSGRIPFTIHWIK